MEVAGVPYVSFVDNKNAKGETADYSFVVSGNTGGGGGGTGGSTGSAIFTFTVFQAGNKLEINAGGQMRDMVGVQIGRDGASGNSAIVEQPASGVYMKEAALGVAGHAVE